jgi:eukaryotic-like serine/threonine-protein kinase
MAGVGSEDNAADSADGLSRRLQSGVSLTPAELELGNASTLPGLAVAPLAPIATDDEPEAAKLEQSRIEAGRATVLPKRSKSTTGSPDIGRARFERVKLLGEGAMGEVELARDNDIRRTVAVKRIKDAARSEAALMRFADEVRIVGQLEHPSIVPIYDVGRDADGQLYLVMKHLNGETMERIITRLRAKDPAYVERFPVSKRAHIFLAVLDAIRYAHARGIIHRDLKPANIMVGPYGEVTVLDWGIAKRIERGAAAQTSAKPQVTTQNESHDQQLGHTALGSLVGTPLYMSPEQAAGYNDELDERSDVYTLSLILLEWLSLEHPLSHKKTLNEVLAAVISEDVSPKYLDKVVTGGVSPAYVHAAEKGLVRDRDKRLASVEALERSLVGAISGRVPINCHVTFARRLSYELMSWIERHPIAYTMLFFATVLAIVGGIVLAIVLAIL